MIRIQTTAGRIAAMSVCSAAKDVRYYLVGIHFELSGDSGLTMVSTDGHRLLKIEAPEDMFGAVGKDDRKSVIINFDKDTLSDFRKAGNRDQIVNIEIDELVTVKYATVTRYATLVDGKFPDWRRIMPAEIAGEGNEVGEAGFNSKYLADFATVSKMLTPAKDAPIEISPRGNSAMLVRILASSDGPVLAVGVLMPIRIGK